MNDAPLVALEAAYILAATVGYWSAIKTHRDRVRNGDTRTLLFESRWHWVTQPVLAGVLLLIYRHWVLALPLAYTFAYWGINAWHVRSHMPRGVNPKEGFPLAVAAASGDRGRLRALFAASLAPTVLTVVGVTTICLTAGILTSHRMAGRLSAGGPWWLTILLMLATALTCFVISALAGATAASLAVGAIHRKKETDDAILRTGSSAGSTKVQRQLMSAIIGRAEESSRAGDLEAVVRIYGEAISRFATSDDPEIAWRVAMALNNSGTALGQLGRASESLEAFDSVVHRYGSSADIRARFNAVDALIKRGIALEDLGHEAEGLRTYDEVMERYGSETEPKIREQCANALWFKAIAVSKAGNRDAAFELLFKAIDVFPDARYRMRVDADLAPLRSDVRWERLTRAP